MDSGTVSAVVAILSFVASLSSGALLYLASRLNKVSNKQQDLEVLVAKEYITKEDLETHVSKEIQSVREILLRVEKQLERERKNEAAA